jgi:hypothetical protein
MTRLALLLILALSACASGFMPGDEGSYRGDGPPKPYCWFQRVPGCVE